MSKNLVVSMACGEKSRAYAQLTHPAIQAYAQRCGADFHALYQEATGYPSIAFQKWEYLKLLGQYDRILHIDADIVVKTTAPNLFELVPANHFAAVNEYPFQDLSRERPPMDRYADLGLYAKATGQPLVSPSFYVNVGLYLFSEAHRHIFSEPIANSPCYFNEQTLINYNLNKSPETVTLLDPRFNMMSIMENTGMWKDDAHMIHYAGNWKGWEDEEILDDMKRFLL